MNFNSISTSNNTTNNNNNQVLFSLNPKAYLFSLSKTKLNILDELARQSNISVNVHLSQNILGKRRGICRETVNRNISDLCEDGVVIKKYNHRHPCDYYLHPLFYDLSFRNAFRNIIMSFKWTPATLMLSANRSIFAYMNSCQLEYVTPLKKKNFFKLKTNTNYVLYNDNLKKQSVASVRVYKDVVNVTSRKEGGSVMLQSEIIISGYVAKISRQFEFTEEQEIKLSAYSDDIVRKAYQATLGKKIERPFNYMLRVCSIEAGKAANKPKITRLEATDEPMAAKVKEEVKKGGEYQKNHTAAEIAQEIAKIRKVDASKMHGGEGYKKRMLYNWADKEYVIEGSDAEKIALMYINRIRVEVGLPPRKLYFAPQDAPEIKPQSTMLNENDVGKVMGHSVEKDSTSLIYERNDEYEEVTDKILYG